MLKSLFWILLSMAAAYLAIVLAAFVFQKKLVFHPHRRVSQDPGDMGLPFEEVWIHVDDGVRLHGWYIPHEEARGTALFLHGNAGNIGDRMDTIASIHRLRLNLLIFDYRGYGRSEGSPSEKGLYRDAEAAYEYLKNQYKIEAKERLVIMGRSLGGAAAAWLAAHHPGRAVILESTFTSAPAVAADVYPWLPARYLIQYRFPVIKWIKQIRIPILIAHSTEDKLIPYSHGRQLYQAAHAPKKFLKLRGSHASAFMDTGDKYHETLNEFLQKHLPPREIKIEQE